MLYTITSLAGYPTQILHMVVSTCYPFIGKSFPYISCLSLHGLHEESTEKWALPNLLVPNLLFMQL